MPYLEQTIDWEIQELPIYDHRGDQIKGYKQIINAHSGNVLNVAAASYTPVKNSRLLEMTEKFASNTGFQIEGYASHRDGQKVMAYLKNSNPKNAVGLPAQDYLIIGNSHDGSTAFFTGLTNRIYRCENMFSQNNQHNKIRHTSSIHYGLREIERTHNAYFDQLNGLYQKFELMSDHKYSDSKTEEDFLFYLLDIPPATRLQDMSSRKRNQLTELYNCLQIETGDLGKNLFALFNTATRYTSHHVKSRERNVYGNMFNIQAEINKRAIQYTDNILTGNLEANHVHERPAAQRMRYDIEDVEIIDYAPAQPPAPAAHAMITSAAPPPRPTADTFNW